MTTQTAATTLTCEADTSSRSSSYAKACGQPASIAYSSRTFDGRERLEARCAKHAGIIKRSRWAQGELVDLTPEVVATITTRLDEAKARRETERAAKREATAVRTEAARAEAQAADAISWSAERDDEQALLGWDSGEPIYCAIPRWFARPAGDTRSWDDIEVKLSTREGWPSTLEVRNPSRMTRSQALALAAALTAAAALIEEA